MSFINYASREINCKIVYYGPGLCGKTTNLQFVYQKTAPDAKGKMISLATETERTLFFDFLPLSLGEIRDLRHGFISILFRGRFLRCLTETDIKGCRRRCFCRRFTGRTN